MREPSIESKPSAIRRIGGYLIGKPELKESSRGFVGKKSERIRMYSCEGKFEGKFIANLALFLGDEGKFNAQKLHADARFLLVGY